MARCWRNENPDGSLNGTKSGKQFDGVMVPIGLDEEQNGFEGSVMTPAMAVRRLTPMECSRLQGFPDDYLSSVRVNGKPLADGPMYKMLGNSMAVPVVRWIAERMLEVDAIARK